VSEGPEAAEVKSHKNMNAVTFEYGQRRESSVKEPRPTTPPRPLTSRSNDCPLALRSLSTLARIAGEILQVEESAQTQQR